MPQSEQNVALAGCSDPQPGHVRWSGEPHSLQKRAPLDCSAPQEAQANPTQRVYDDGQRPGSGGTRTPAAPGRASHSAGSVRAATLGQPLRMPRGCERIGERTVGFSDVDVARKTWEDLTRDPGLR